MTPQLFINYKLKSVAHLPWRMLTYKALNTFIDDLFAFVIKMPMMYRIGCLRDGMARPGPGGACSVLGGGLGVPPGAWGEGFWSERSCLVLGGGPGGPSRCLGGSQGSLRVLGGRNSAPGGSFSVLGSGTGVPPGA